MCSAVGLLLFVVTHSASGVGECFYRYSTFCDRKDSGVEGTYVLWIEVGVVEREQKYERGRDGIPVDQDDDEGVGGGAGNWMASRFRLHPEIMAF